MTTLDLDEAIRSLLGDIGDAAGVPSAPGLVRLSTAPAPERRRVGNYLVAASTVVVIGLAVAAVLIHRSRDDSPATGHSLVNVAPGVTQWLELPSPPPGMTRVHGDAFEVSPTCIQVDTTAADPTCSAISGTAQVAYANQSPTVIEVATVFTPVTLDAYINGLIRIGPTATLKDQTVTVRGHAGRLLSATDVKLLAWQERPGVIGQVRIVADTANTDLVTLADTLIQRDWDPDKQVQT
jgi:hypothetical protein